MTVTLDLPPRLYEQVQADADAFNRAVADFLRDLIADRYEEADKADGADDNDLRAHLEAHPLPASLTQPLGPMLRASQEAADAGRVIDGDTFLANIRKRAGRA